MSEQALVNRLLPLSLMNKISHKWLQEKVKDGKIYMLETGFIIDENGEYEKFILSTKE